MSVRDLKFAIPALAALAVITLPVCATAAEKSSSPEEHSTKGKKVMKEDDDDDKKASSSSSKSGKVSKEAKKDDDDDDDKDEKEHHGHAGVHAARAAHAVRHQGQAMMHPGTGPQAQWQMQQRMGPQQQYTGGSQWTPGDWPGYPTQRSNSCSSGWW
jgi:hypothetical protein